MENSHEKVPPPPKKKEKKTVMSSLDHTLEAANINLFGLVFKWFLGSEPSLLVNTYCFHLTFQKYCVMSMDDLAERGFNGHL